MPTHRPVEGVLHHNPVVLHEQGLLCSGFNEKIWPARVEIVDVYAGNAASRLKQRVVDPGCVGSRMNIDQQERLGHTYGLQ
jgi:hypothetical protein